MTSTQAPEKIAVIIYSLAMGGAETASIRRVQALNQSGQQAELIVICREGKVAIPEDVPVHFIFNKPRKKWLPFWYHYAAKKLRHFFIHHAKHTPFTIALSNTHKCNKIVAQAALEKHTTTTVFYVVHNSLLNELTNANHSKKQRARYALHNGKHLICVSKGIENEIRQHTDLRPASLTTIYNPVDLNALREKANTTKNTEPSPYILHIGRYANQKRHDLLLEAFSYVKKEIKLVCLTDKHARLQHDVEQQKNEKTLKNPVEVRPFNDNPMPILKQAALLVLCSDYEGYPTVIVEALALGTPVVSTRCAFGPEEQLTGTLAEYLVPTNDPHALAAKIDNALASATRDDFAQASILNELTAAATTERLLAAAQQCRDQATQ